MIVDGGTYTRTHRNLNLNKIVTPLNVNRFRELLVASKYNKVEMEFLVQGFAEGFNIGYRGPTNRKDTLNNIPITVGTKEIMWQKLMKEVTAERYAGPFDQIPFSDHYIQSPIRLVPKAGNQTRLIFHLSYDFKEFKSVNFYTPAEICSVQYRDLDFTIKHALHYLQIDPQTCLWFAKSDMKSAFRMLLLSHASYWVLVMKAINPETNKTCYFIDKCLPFGSSISCSHYQHFSNALAHILQYLTNKMLAFFTVTNYLDDFLFIEVSKMKCN